MFTQTETAAREAMADDWVVFALDECMVLATPWDGDSLEATAMRPIASLL